MRKITALLVLLAISSGAAAQEKFSPLPSHLPLGKEVCYGRSYDAAHLARHPKQLVTSLYLFRDLSPDQNTETVPLTREQALQQDGDAGVNIQAYVRFKNRKGVFWNALHCGKSADGTVTRCGIDCDGGHFDLKPQGKSLILINSGFVLIGGCGAPEEESENPVHFSPGADDKTFRLEPLPLAQCAALRDSLKPMHAKLGSPLRSRFAKEEAVCFARQYSDVHLAQNPKQTVRRIAMLKPSGALDKDDPGLEFTFRIELKNGKKFVQRAKCFAEDYAWACPAKAELDTVKDFYITRASDTSLNIRDRRGKLREFFAAELGEDDRLFRLDAAADSTCEF